MSSLSVQLCVLVITASWLAVLYSGDTCVTYTSRGQRDGYGCTSESAVSASLFEELSIQKCTFECLRSDQCVATSYDSASRSCRTYSQPCAILEPQPDSSFMLMRAQEEESCVNWVTFQNSAQRSNPRLAFDNTGGRAAARAYHDQGHLLIGHWHHSSDTTTISLPEGHQNFHSSGFEFLEVKPHCSMMWVFHSAGDPLPLGAVVGGNMTDGRALYVMRGVPSGASTGYYDDTTGVGLYYSGGIQSVTEVELLIIA